MQSIAMLIMTSYIAGTVACETLTRYFFTKEERSDEVLAKQLMEAAILVQELVTCPLQVYQRDALICLASDVMAGLAMSSGTDLRQSLLWKLVNHGMFHVAASEFYPFCYTDKRVNPRAWQKRRAEHHLFVTGLLLFP